jgi:superfamily I DNA and/or RNA helicase
VGDSNQMPPTSVAQVKSNGLDGDDLSEYLDDVTFEKDSESILSLASDSNVPSVMLKWHYRSEDESLIAFSNKKYYRNELTTFPSPSPERVTKGLSFTHVPNGVFVRPGMTGAGRRGTNPAEIDEIIKDLGQ